MPPRRFVTSYPLIALALESLLSECTGERAPARRRGGASLWGTRDRIAQPPADVRRIAHHG